MKKIFITSTILVVAFFTFSFTKMVADKWMVKTGTNLLYAVTSGAENYDLNATVASMENGSLNLNLKFTNKNQTTSAVGMTKENLATSHSQTTKFTNGNMPLEKSLAIWFSKGMYTELSYGKTYLYLDGSTTPTPLVSVGTETMAVKVNGEMKNVSVIHAKEPSYNGKTNLAEYWILNDSENPIILKMSTDITCQIKEVTL